MSKSKIEWTDRTLLHSRKFHALIKHGEWVQSLLINPVKYILVLFGTIAGCTTGHDISWRCLPSLRDGMDMIPGSSFISAIHAHTFRVFKQGFTSFWRNALYPPAVFISMVFALFPVFRIGGVVFPRISVATRATSGIIDFISREPLFAAMTPNQTPVSHSPSLTLAWSRGISAPAIVADSGKTIISRVVNSELLNGFPRLTFPAPLQTPEQFLLILIKCQSAFFGGYFHDAHFASHHSPRFLQSILFYYRKGI